MNVKEMIRGGKQQCSKAKKKERTNADYAKQFYSKAKAEPGLLSPLACPSNIYCYITPLTYGELLQKHEI